MLFAVISRSNISSACQQDGCGYSWFYIWGTTSASHCYSWELGGVWMCVSKLIGKNNKMSDTLLIDVGDLSLILF